jgi:hypothetical protein
MYSGRPYVALKQPVRMPPIPEDQFFVDGKNRVFAAFSKTPIAIEAQEPVHIGWLRFPEADGTLDESVIFGEERKLFLLSSGDGDSIPCRLD